MESSRFSSYNNKKEQEKKNKNNKDIKLNKEKDKDSLNSGSEEIAVRDEELSKIKEAKYELKKSGKISNKAKFIITIIALAFIIILLSIYSAYTTYTVYKKYYHSTLGDGLEFTVKKQGNFVKSITYPSSLLSNLTYNQRIDIKSDNLSDDMYVRTKVIYTDYKNNSLDVEIILNENWKKGEDGYYYFNDVLNANEIITLTNKIKIQDENQNKVNSIITVLVETMFVSSDIKIWNTPLDWLI